MCGLGAMDADRLNVPFMAGFFALLFSAKLKPHGYYLELFGQAIIGVKVPNSSHVASIQHLKVLQFIGLLASSNTFAALSPLHPSMEKKCLMSIFKV